ncbi:hypothetical protein [Caulobacter sp. 17J65-9]|uniref:hypothetical protein n=1 Tax=Caulobacter sp. 17J65-9 TaxID=2709382 RepID=UPI0013C79EAB|nr:hypothetical protein [Caulobacter sp. 17J65-9]NEX91168.1 hypothetical protein [Caulobacter sp. 17J65-9]
MGSTNPDRIPAIQWRRQSETLGEMRANGWRLTSRCRTCMLEMVVNLDILILLKGEDFSLWNRTAPCRRLYCPGIVDFWAVPHPRALAMKLAADWPPGVPPRVQRSA